MAQPFLSAKWKNLFMVNYEVDRALLTPLVPAHTELDIFDGKALVSLVAFQFLQTRVKGFRIPWHVNFPEINLRLYLKRTVDGELRRGVAFIKEIVPRHAISFVANTLFNEHYITRRMTHRVAVGQREDGIHASAGPQPSMAQGDQLRAEYTFQEKGRTQRMACNAAVRSQEIKPGSMEDFITEHYYGYNGGANRSTLEYKVEHPSWRTYPVQSYSLDVDFAATYGATWGFLSAQRPHSVLLAEGSEIKVFAATKVDGNG